MDLAGALPAGISVHREVEIGGAAGIWFTPTSEWGPGVVELLELPAPHEGMDNIAVWWTPERQISPGTPVELSYRVSFCSGDRPDHDLAKGIAYRVKRDRPGSIQIEIDFYGPAVAGRAQHVSPTADVASIRGETSGITCKKQASGVWTTSFEVKPTGEGPVELTVVLKDGERELSETWAYLCPLEPPPVSLPPWRLKEQRKESTP